MHKNRTLIDEALLRSVPLRSISGQFQISKSSLHRHKNHIPSDMVQAKKTKEVCRAETIFNKLISLKSDAERITKKAETNNDLKTALTGVREQGRLLEILAKIEGRIQQPQIDLTINNLCLSKIYNRLGRKIEKIEVFNETNGQ